MGDHLRRMAGIKDGMSDTGDAPDVEMKEGPGPSARDPARRAPAPIRGQETEKRAARSHRCSSVSIVQRNSDGVSWPQAVRSPQPLFDVSLIQ